MPSGEIAPSFLSLPFSSSRNSGASLLSDMPMWIS
jgi:hypothetical protein